MSETYQQLMDKANALMEEAKSVRKQELAAVVADIKAKMKEYSITLEDLGGQTRSVETGGTVAKAKKPAKYKGPTGELWAGGPGPRPKWVQEVMAQGHELDQYRI